MTDDDAEMLEQARAIAKGAKPSVRALKTFAKHSFSTGAGRAESAGFFLERLQHYVYAGDTLLHVAAAAYDVVSAKLLLAAGAQVRAQNRRGAEPLHYAADGGPGSDSWNPRAQAAMVKLLVAHGGDPNAFNKDGVGPLHRAVRSRSTGAVRALLACGADPKLRSGRGSTPRELAEMTTGRGGSGSTEAKTEQRVIRQLLTHPPARPTTRGA